MVFHFTEECFGDYRRDVGDIDLGLTDDRGNDVMTISLTMGSDQLHHNHPHFGPHTYTAEKKRSDKENVNKSFKHSKLL